MFSSTKISDIYRIYITDRANPANEDPYISWLPGFQWWN